jgi:phosphohistidine phosphatase
MTSLYLLRHAKSSWKNPALADHDRPLALRGRRAAAALADHIVEHQIAEPARSSLGAAASVRSPDVQL